MRGVFQSKGGWIVTFRSLPIDMVQSLRNVVPSLSLFAACMLLVHAVHAQKQPMYDFLMHVAGMDGRDQEKIVRASINDQDPSALVSIDVPGQRVKVRTSVVLDRHALEPMLGAFGVSIISLAPLVGSGPTERVSPAGTLPGFPVYVPTGDPANDEAVYQMNKAAWVEAHPDLYPPPSGNEDPGPR